MLSSTGLDTRMQTVLLLLLRVPLHFELLPVECLIVLLLVFEHLLVHGFLVRQALTLICSFKLTHVVQLSAATIALTLQALVYAESAALLRHN